MSERLEQFLSRYLIDADLAEKLADPEFKRPEWLGVDIDRHSTKIWDEDEASALAGYHLLDHGYEKICGYCDGSGEGMIDGTICGQCDGKGTTRAE